MRFITWNTQGKNPTAFLMVKEHALTPSVNSSFANGYKPDFICLQESGTADWDNAVMVNGNAWIPVSTSNPNQGYKKITDYKLSTTDNYHGVEIPWQVSEDEELGKQANARCSLLILWKSTIATHDQVQLSGWYDGNVKHRPVFWVQFTDGTRVGCIHAPCSNDATYIQNAIKQVSNNGAVAKWVLVGDFNMTPQDLKNAVHNVQTVNCSKSTQLSGKELDYAVYSGIQFTKSEPATEFVKSDHLQVRFE